MDRSKTPIRPALFFLLFAIFSYFFLDQMVLSWVGNSFKTLSKILSALLFPPFYLTVWLGAFIIARIRRSRWTLPLFEIAAAQCISILFARISKVLLGRARPDLFLKKGIYGFYGFDLNSVYHSFPSGHTLMAFTLATSLALIFPRLRFLFYSMATLISLSRIFLLKHYLSDVIATAAIGMLLASFIHIASSKIGNLPRRPSKWVFGESDHYPKAKRE